MADNFAVEVLQRLPLAEGVLSLFQWACDDAFLQDLFDRHRGGCYERVISFATLVGLVQEALLQHQGSGRKSFERQQERGELSATVQAAYQKLGGVPLAVTEAFLAETTARLLEVMPGHGSAVLAPSLQALRPIVVDGKAIKKVPKRLKPLRGHRSGLLGGKALVALDLEHGLALALATDRDGETNDAKLVPALVQEVRQRVGTTPILWIADRLFGNLRQTTEFMQEGCHFLVRYCKKTGFHADPERAAQTGSDGQGRAWREEWGWLGRPEHPQRHVVRRITLERAGEEDIVLVSDLLDGVQYPAEDLLAAYQKRWGIERVFQQITEVFALQHLIGTRPEGTLFQLAFCLLLYNLIQVVRRYVAQAQQLAPERISTELLFDDARRQLIALQEVLALPRALTLWPAALTAEALRRRLRVLLAKVWTKRWLKSPSRKHQPPPKSGQRNHTSVHRVLQASRQAQIKDQRCR